MRDRTCSVHILSSAACAATALMATLLTASAADARRQSEAPTVARAPAAVSSGPWRPEYYYLDPRPDAMFESLLAALSKEPMLPEDRYATVIMLGMLLEKNPARTFEWAEALEAIPVQNKSTVWHAMAGANTNEAVMALEAIKNADFGTAPTIDYIVKAPPRDLLSAPITSPNSLTELWAAFFISGDEEYVRRLIQALEWAVPEEEDQNRALIGGAAYWSLVRNCFAHSRVLKVCRAQSEGADGRIGRALKSVLVEADKQLAAAPCPEPAPVHSRE